MFNLLFLIIVAAFVAMLVVNIYFRVKVFKHYKYLVQNRVEFNTSHFFNKDKMEKEVLTRYPQHREEILLFVSMIHRSVQLASALLVIIIAFGYLLLRYR